MKRYISMALAVLLLLTCVLVGAPGAEAAKATESRAIAIVFDNSGSMYVRENQAWCRATYAMEVFASMLNEGDTLLIYPMNPISVGGKEYTMESPYKITESSQATSIREISTPKAEDTPIESIDCAAKGLKEVKADKKYMIVLTDGDIFYLGGNPLSVGDTKNQLDARFGEYAGKDMTVMYLGIDKAAVMPNTAESEYFAKKHAKNSADVLSTLTVMCNQIFGRDTLPKNRISGNTVEFDISMNKLIVFVQGENVSGLKVTGASGPVGEQISATSTMYSTAGSGNYKSVPDSSLQGMMVTYTDCAAGSYTIEYSGTASSIEVYYEPNADLDFVFTDAAGNTVDPNALYEGEYKVSFGMKDGRTGQLIQSDLLGNTNYRGSYYINGVEYPITQDGNSGEVPVSLKMGDTFDAKLTVTYLSGYTISKDTRDFGWPEGGIQVAARPAGDLRVEISGGEEGTYSLQDLEEGKPFIAKIYYQDTQLTGEELEKVELKWEPETSNAEIKQEFADDHYILSMHYKNPEAPQDTVCGECTVFIYAYYTAQGSDQSQGQAPLTYNIEDDFSPLQIELAITQDYIVISELAESAPIIAKLTMEGRALTAEEFAVVQLQVETGGIAYTATPNPENSSYTIQLQPTEGIAEGDYLITVTGTFTDHIGRTTETDESAWFTLSSMPMWLKWAIRLGILLALIILIVMIMRIKVLPKKVMTAPKNCSLTIGATAFDGGISYPTKLSGKNLSILCRKGAMTFGVKVAKATPGPDSYLYKPSKSRSIMVQPKDVSLQGGGTSITEANINGTKFAIDPQTRRFGPAQQNAKPIILRNGAPVKWTGSVMDNGRKKTFSVSTKLEFK